MHKLQLARAISRVSPRMLAYHLKRALRNRLAKKFPRIYAAHIKSVASNVPLICLTGKEDLRLAASIDQFYAPEYRAQAVSVCEGVVTLLGVPIDFGAPNLIDWHVTIDKEEDFHLWRMKLSHMGFLCPMLMDGHPEQIEAASKVVDGFLLNSDFGVDGCF